MVKGDHIRPDLVDIGGVGKVDHVGGEAAAGAHVHLQGYHIPLLAQARLVLGEAEELKVDEAALDSPGLHRGPACLAHVGGQVLDDVVDGVVLLVDDVHNGHGGDVARFKHGLALGVDDGVVGVDLGVDKFLHDIGHPGAALAQEAAQILLALQLVGVRGAYAVVRLHHHRPAHLLDKGHAAVEVVHHTPAAGGDARLGVVVLHLGLILDAVDVALLEAGGDVELGAQPGVPLQPVFVVALQPVDAAVLVDEKGYSPVYRLGVLQTVHPVVFGEAVAHMVGQLFIGLVANAQHVEAVVLQGAAELPVVGGKVGGDKNGVFHGVNLFSLVSRLVGQSSSKYGAKYAACLCHQGQSWFTS